jgi:hypothetical protein
MLHVIVTAEDMNDLADQLWEILDRVEQVLEDDIEEVIEYDEDGYYYDEAEDELFWVDFATGEEFYYDEEVDEWFECDEIVEFAEEDIDFEDEQDVDFA